MVKVDVMKQIYLKVTVTVTEYQRHTTLREPGAIDAYLATHGLDMEKPYTIRLAPNMDACIWEQKHTVEVDVL